MDHLVESHAFLLNQGLHKDEPLLTVGQMVQDAGSPFHGGQGSDFDRQHLTSPPERLGARVLNPKQSARLRTVSCDKGHRSSGENEAAKVQSK